MTQILYKFREIDKYAIDILVNKRLYLSPWTTLNDPHEAQMYTKDTKNLWIHANPTQLQRIDKKYLNRGFIDENLIDARICALSCAWSSNLLWSHYAAGHAGIAIGVILSNQGDGIKELKVKYDDKVPKVEQHPLKEEDVLNALRHKSKEWEREKEVRFVTFDHQKTYLGNIEIKEIDFGLRTTKEDIELIYNILKDDNINFYQICRKPGAYNLNKGDIPWLKKYD